VYHIKASTNTVAIAVDIVKYALGGNLWLELQPSFIASQLPISLGLHEVIFTKACLILQNWTT
jgi:hypothetical protein